MPDKSEMPETPRRAGAPGKKQPTPKTQAASGTQPSAEKQQPTQKQAGVRTQAGTQAGVRAQAGAEVQAGTRAQAGAEVQAAPGNQAAPEERTGPAGQPAAKEQPRRRQARGERRIAQLLEAAASVFCTTGYAAASTNAIAREAGVSPGTLYQFFPNKEAIAIELGDRLMHKMRETYGTALAPVAPATPLAEAVGGAVDRFIAFNTEHPEFFALMHGPDTPGRIADEHEALHSAMTGRVEALLDSFLTDVPPADITRTAHVCLGIYKSGLELVLSHTGDEREAYVQEIKNVLVRYLEPLTGDPLGGAAGGAAEGGVHSTP